MDRELSPWFTRVFKFCLRSCTLISSIVFPCRPPTLPPKPKKKFTEVKPGKEGSRPKLFGGSIEEYVEVSRGGEYYDDDDDDLGMHDDDDDNSSFGFVIIGLQRTSDSDRIHGMC